MEHKEFFSKGFIPSGSSWQKAYDDAVKLRQGEILEQAGVFQEYTSFSSRASLGDSTPTSVSAVNDQLTGLPPVSDFEQDMIEKTFLWLQCVINGYAKQAGWSSNDIHDADKRNTPQFWTFVNAALHDTPWAYITFTNSQYIHNSVHSGSIDLYGIVASAVAVITGTKGSDAMAATAKNMATSKSVGINDVGSFFWNHKYTHQEKSQWMSGPVLRTNATLSSCYAFTYMNYTQDDWRSLFVESHYQEFTLQVKGMAYDFLPQTWASQKDAVSAKVDQFVKDTVKNAPFDAP